jgi:hypothetical protein
MKINGSATSKPPPPSDGAMKSAVILFLVLCAFSLVGADRHLSVAIRRPSSSVRAASQTTQAHVDCGYDARGAEDSLLEHDQRAPVQHPPGPSRATGADQTLIRPRLTDLGDIAVIEDDGNLVIPPRKFDLKRKSVLFTPDGDGYRIAASDIGFIKDFGAPLTPFIGIDGLTPDSNNGYRELVLSDAPFSFSGQTYDTVFVGTNGYITFGKGDTSARPSASALATEEPRIAPLWADLNLTARGNIYYNRLSDRHLITWVSVRQALFDGSSTFQVSLFDDGRICFTYKKVKVRAALVGLSGGNSSDEPVLVDLSRPPTDPISHPFCELFAKEPRLDLPAIGRAFFAAHGDLFDTVYIWTTFPYDNGTGYAHFFNVRNTIQGVGLPIFDRGRAYGSSQRLSSVVSMGNLTDWPDDPQSHVVGLNSAISIVCHEQGHRWLAYVHFDDAHRASDDLLGRDSAHWSFLVDTRTNPQGTFSSLMEGNAWSDGGQGSFTTVESAVNYFSELDQYLMGLLPPDEVGDIPYLAVDDQFKLVLRDKSPISGISINAVRKATSVGRIELTEGPRIPDAAQAPKTFRIAFILLTQPEAPQPPAIDKLDRYRAALVRYFSVATDRRGSLDSLLQ